MFTIYKGNIKRQSRHTNKHFSNTGHRQEERQGSGFVGSSPDLDEGPGTSSPENPYRAESGDVQSPGRPATGEEESAGPEQVQIARHGAQYFRRAGLHDGVAGLHGAGQLQ